MLAEVEAGRDFSRADLEAAIKALSGQEPSPTAVPTVPSQS